jgi:hypothetical protein
MAYEDFTLRLVTERFGLEVIDRPFCESLPLAEPGGAFAKIFGDFFELGRVAQTDKARAEFLIAPVLVNARSFMENTVQLFSGHDFDVDHDRGLNGCCDFIFSKSSNNPFTIDTPVMMLVRPQDGILDDGWGPCVAQMLAAQIYNQDRKQSISTIYGCTTSGKMWQFLKLEGTELTIDVNNYYLMPVQKILGILTWMLSEEKS